MTPEQRDTLKAHAVGKNQVAAKWVRELLSDLEAATARAEAAEAVVREMVETADYLISLHERIMHGKPVRDLCEAQALYQSAKRRAQALGVK